jgi:FkbM family methyltransferase
LSFEPQAEGLASLNDRKSDLETYLPYVIGDGSPATLHVTALPGMTSLLEPNHSVLGLFNGFSAWSQVIQKVPVKTWRLDGLPEITAIDMLKIDVQGSELAVFKSGRERLKRAVVVHTEVCFLQLYKDQPLLAEIDLDLRGLGFIPHEIVHVNRRTILPVFHPEVPNSAVNQVIFADIVYVRDFSKHELMDDEQLKHLALIAQCCYGSFDLAVNCLTRLLQRGGIAPDAVDVFLASMKAATLAA